MQRKLKARLKHLRIGSMPESPYHSRGNIPEGKSVTSIMDCRQCKLHHSAYDAFIIGVTQLITLSKSASDILEEEDGPRPFLRSMAWKDCTSKR